MYTSEDANNNFTRLAVAHELEGIEQAYRVAVSGKQPDRRLVSRYRATITKLLRLAERIGRDFFAVEIEKAGWSRQNPHASDRDLMMLVAEYPPERSVIDVLAGQRSDIDHWLKTTGDAAFYRKRVVRKLVVEPFLQLMARQEVTTSSKQRPRKRIFDALFDWLGVEKKFRPSDAAINAIARGLEARASASESNAKRRTEN
jgi:hypothetical protein